MSRSDSGRQAQGAAAPSDVLNRRQLLMVGGAAAILLFGGFYVSSMLSDPQVTGSFGKHVRVSLKSLRFSRGVAGPIPYDAGASVFVTKKGTDWLALDQSCPHQQCAVAWHPDHERFICPCHGSIFNQYGDLVHGPATRGMYRHQVQSGSDSLVIEGRV